MFCRQVLATLFISETYRFFFRLETLAALIRELNLYYATAIFVQHCQKRAKATPHLIWTNFLRTILFGLFSLTNITYFLF